VAAVGLVDLVDRAVAQRDDVQVAVRAGLEVRPDAEVAAEEQRLALNQVPLVDVVGDLVVEPRVVDVDVTPAAREVEAEDVPALQEVACAAGVNRSSSYSRPRSSEFRNPMPPGATSPAA
jgi:hypothetical protein